MTFDEFLNIVNHAKTADVLHFKPYSEPILNSHHQDIKDDVFAIKIKADKFELFFPNRDDATRNTLSLSELQTFFKELGWEHFIPYDPNYDILEWLEHPSWAIYG